MMATNRIAPTCVVEVNTSGMHLSLYRGFLQVKQENETVGKAALDDIGCVLVSVPGVSVTTNLIDALAKRNIPLVTVGKSYMPSAMVIPLLGSGLLADRMQAQSHASLPTRKRVWAFLVRGKIEAQAAVLSRTRGKNIMRLQRMARHVRSGDPNNMEAQAARLYWPDLMGSGFRRDRSEPGINAMLNYGYTILRSSAARAICAAGLHPMLGLHHLTRGDGMRLADDLMEPFRPAIDLVVRTLMRDGITMIGTTSKQRLVRVLHADYQMTADEVSPLSTCLVRLAQTLGKVFQGELHIPELPLSPIPLHEGVGMDDSNNKPF